jgi:hypothetical protein
MPTASQPNSLAASTALISMVIGRYLFGEQITRLQGEPVNVWFCLSRQRLGGGKRSHAENVLQVERAE